jgi:hypothetical protein
MKYTASALALALGLGLAAAAQAQGTTQNATPSPNTNMQSTAPASTAQNQPTQMQQQPQIKKQRHAAKHAISHRGMSQRNDIRQVQLRLKQEGLFRGKVTGKMDRQTRIALNRFEQQNGLPRSTKLARVNKMLGTQTAASGSSMPQMRTAHLSKQQRMTRTARLGKQQQTRVAHLKKQQQTRIAHARVPKSETTGVGSSMPNKPTPANTPVVNPSGNNSAPSGAGNGSTIPPKNTPANQPNTSK